LDAIIRTTPTIGIGIHATIFTFLPLQERRLPTMFRFCRRGHLELKSRDSR
jgi:hypothetical protein